MKDGKPAFPISSLEQQTPHHDLEWVISGGLTKREYFAAMAMQGLCACSISGGHKMFNVLASEAVRYADELIKELEIEEK